MSVTIRVVGDPDANPPVSGVAEIQTTGTIFQMNNVKLYVSVVLCL